MNLIIISFNRLFLIPIYSWNLNRNNKIYYIGSRFNLTVQKSIANRTNLIKKVQNKTILIKICDGFDVFDGIQPFLMAFILIEIDGIGSKMIETNCF